MFSISFLSPRAWKAASSSSLSRESIEKTHASKTQLDVHGRGLSGVQGANEIIETLERRPTIEQLILGNNAFGDEGITKILQYLSGGNGVKLKIEVISLNSCGIGNLGLRAICAYVNGNEHLKSLFLQNNEFDPSWALCSTFTSAINNSRLRLLSLTSNPQLGDTFVFRFLPNLATPYLLELHLSATNLTPISTSHIVNLLSSDPPPSASDDPSSTQSKPLLIPSLSPTEKAKTRLQNLRLNGNNLTLACAERIVDALERSNFSIRHLEMFANNFLDYGAAVTQQQQQAGAPSPAGSTVSLPSSSSSSSSDDGTTSPPSGSNSPTTLNVRAKSPATFESLIKTRLPVIFARNHLLTSQVQSSALRLLSPARCLLLTPVKYSDNPDPPPCRGWRSLPTELQQHVLSFVEPVGLSPAQYVRIWQYASDRATLPRLFELRGKGAGMGLMEKRMEWLMQVGCERFERYDGWQDDLAKLA